ncbi:nuclear transport factor 2 family protein [Spirosoma flavum]|uniref:SnoaL-like domain-containing protein n=1 Tax=Spirosoma flavum TaxID=2048557 RepID=A0ABW6AN51_9BACT
MTKTYSGKRVEVKRAVAEGNLVVLHCFQQWSMVDGLGLEDWAGIDTFRFDDTAKIVEHWNVLQLIPLISTNVNSIF